MVDSTIKFNIVNNKSFHDELERKLLDEPVDASRSIFVDLLTDTTGKCYYPLFLRQPFNLKDFDFCSMIDPEHLQQLKDREIIPMVCMLSESWPLFNSDANRIFRNSAYFNIINQLESNDIKEKDVVWLTCNKYVRQDPRVKAKFIHFDFFLEQQKILKNKFLPLTKIKHRYLSMAQGVPRHHRFAITYQLYNNNLLQHGAISCTGYENFTYNTNAETTDEYMSKLENFNNSAFATFKNMLPLTIDSKSTKIEVPEHKSYQSPINLHQDGRDESHLFKNVFLNVVNETHQPDNTVFITEKTYRSINYCRPFVINGDRGSLKYLKDMGFKTFDQFWDESYDQETSDHTRIVKIIAIVKDITSRTDSQLLTLFQSMLPVLEHNYNTLKNYEQWSKLN
jgi:hypothetical protein